MQALCPRTGSDSTKTPVPQVLLSYTSAICSKSSADHNILYRDIEIEMSDDAPSSQTAVNEIALDGEGESSVISNFPELKYPMSSTIITAPTSVYRVPLSAYTHVLMLNRWLYPDGTNGYKTSHDPPITTLDYFQSRHLSSDTCWGSHISYLFWSYNVLEQCRLNENISVAI